MQTSLLEEHQRELCHLCSYQLKDVHRPLLSIFHCYRQPCRDWKTSSWPWREMTWGREGGKSLCIDHPREIHVHMYAATLVQYYIVSYVETEIFPLQFKVENDDLWPHLKKHKLLLENKLCIGTYYSSTKDVDVYRISPDSSCGYYSRAATIALSMCADAIYL